MSPTVKEIPCLPSLEYLEDLRGKKLWLRRMESTQVREREVTQL